MSAASWRRRAQRAARAEAEAAAQLAHALDNPAELSAGPVTAEGTFGGLTATAHTAIAPTGEMALIARLDRLSLAVEQLVTASQRRPSRWRWVGWIAQGVAFLASVATVVALFWTANH